MSGITSPNFDFTQIPWLPGGVTPKLENSSRVWQPEWTKQLASKTKDIDPWHKIEPELNYTIAKATDELQKAAKWYFDFVDLLGGGLEESGVYLEKFTIKELKIQSPQTYAIFVATVPQSIIKDLKDDQRVQMGVFNSRFRENRQQRNTLKDGKTNMAHTEQPTYFEEVDAVVEYEAFGVMNVGSKTDVRVCIPTPVYKSQYPKAFVHSAPITQQWTYHPDCLNWGIVISSDPVRTTALQRDYKSYKGAVGLTKLAQKQAGRPDIAPPNQSPSYTFLKPNEVLTTFYPVWRTNDTPQEFLQFLSPQEKDRMEFESVKEYVLGRSTLNDGPLQESDDENLYSEISGSEHFYSGDEDPYL